MESVLLVEDDEDIRETLDEFLTGQGYVVETAVNGLDGLQKLEGHRPGLVLLDLMMPVMNGWEFLEKKKIAPEICKVPVLLISAVPGKPYVPGALATLRKPIDLRRLMDFVELYCA